MQVLKTRDASAYAIDGRRRIEAKNKTGTRSLGAADSGPPSTAATGISLMGAVGHYVTFARSSGSCDGLTARAYWWDGAAWWRAPHADVVFSLSSNEPRFVSEPFATLGRRGRIAYRVTDFEGATVQFTLTEERIDVA